MLGAPLDMTDAGNDSDLGLSRALVWVTGRYLKSHSGTGRKEADFQISKTVSAFV